jgi:hypothetical protein
MEAGCKMSKSNLNITPEIQAYIKQAVAEGIKAGKEATERKKESPFIETEKRLYALPILRKRVAEGSYYPDKKRSKDIVLCSRRGTVSQSDAEEAIENAAKAAKERDLAEIEIMDKALSEISRDQYFMTITMHYFNGITDSEIAETIPCERTTVWRNRIRLVQQLSVWLYGASSFE